MADSEQVKHVHSEFCAVGCRLTRVTTRAELEAWQKSRVSSASAPEKQTEASELMEARRALVWMLRTLKASREVQKCEVCSELEGEIERFLGDGAGALAGELSTYLAQCVELAEARKALAAAKAMARWFKHTTPEWNKSVENAINKFEAAAAKVKAEAGDEAV